jgi:thiamine-monophosphate kinase
VTTVVLGIAEKPLTRSGAKPGDGLWVSGPLGLGYLGRKARDAIAPAKFTDAIAGYARPRAHIAEGLTAAREGAHALIDVTDGFVCDAARIASASGVGVEVDEALLAAAFPRVLDVAAALGEKWLDAMLYGGDDYVLVAASDRPLTGFVRVGSFVTEEGARLVAREGTRGLYPRGFDHFGDDTAAT